MQVVEILFVLTALIGAWLNSQMDIRGFYCWLLSNIFFTSWNIYHGDYGQATLFAVYTVISANGIYKWKTAPAT